MKKILLSTAFTLLSLQGLAHAAQPLDKIVAIVNDDVVTRSELDRNLGIIKMQLAQENSPAQSEKDLDKQALDQIINKKLQLQIAKQAGVTITDADFKRAVAFIAKQNNMSVADLYARINHDGMTTAEYNTQMREQITLQKLQQQQVQGHINVTQDEISAYLRTNVWQNPAMKEYHVEDVLIPLNDKPSATDIAAAKTEAETVIASLKTEAGAPSDKNAQTTDLGWRKMDEIPSLFTKPLASMQAHDVSAPIEAPNGIHILRLTEVRSAGASIEAEAPSRDQAQEILMQRKFAEAVQNWVSKQRSQAFIKTSLNA